MDLFDLRAKHSLTSMECDREVDVARLTLATRWLAPAAAEVANQRTEHPTSYLLRCSHCIHTNARPHSKLRDLSVASTTPGLIFPEPFSHLETLHHQHKALLSRPLCDNISDDKLPASASASFNEGHWRKISSVAV